MFVTILTIIYGCLVLTGAFMVAKKQKAGFVISSMGCVLQATHVLFDPTLIGVLIMSIGFLCININVLKSKAWKDEKWL